MILRFRRQILLSAAAFLISVSAVACGLSVPNLEPPECTQSRNAVKKFYSYHFGNDLSPSSMSAEQKQEFLTGELRETLREQPETGFDYFTQTEDYPKAFRTGTCEVVSEGRTFFEVLLFWKDDEQSLQREIKVELIKKDNNWLINKVENK